MIKHLVLPLALLTATATMAQKDSWNEILELKRSLCGNYAREAIIVSEAAAKGMSYEEAIRQPGVMSSVLKDAQPVLRNAYHGMAGAPSSEVRSQSYRMCADAAQREIEPLQKKYGN